jgi:signal transduction histidine kinase
LGSSIFAGYLLAWSVIYVTAAGYAIWARRRPQVDPGIPLLGALFGVLALASLAIAAASLSTGKLEHSLERVGRAVMIVAPVVLVHYVHAESRTPIHQPRFRWAYGGAIVIALLSLGGTFDAGGTAGNMLVPNAAGRGVAVITALSAMTASYFVIRSSARGKKGGSLLFIGACLLAVLATSDAVIEIVSGERTIFVAVGFALFSHLLFVSQVVRFARRRERLVARTAELSRRSESLTTRFRELNQRQDELVRKEQLAAIGELAAVVAHEVRNPLAVISNAVATLRRANLSDEHRETLLGILSEEAARLNQLVGDLLHYARPLSLEKQSINLRELVDKAVKVLDEHPNVLVEIEEAEELPKVGGDALLIRQALDNVVNNALQAMGGGGTLHIELRKSEEPAGVELVMRDTGEGMDTVVRKRALDPFFTTRPAGTGLGLAIVARVIDAHGGTLTIHSERGAGTEVRLFLPTSHKQPARLGRGLLPPVVQPFGQRSQKKEAS